MLDLATEAPGPMLLDQGQLTDALLDLPAAMADSADRYAAFRERYCALEDGHATDRVLDQVFGG